MTLKSFIIVIDDEIDPQEITQFMRDTPAITQWWHHLPSAYIVTTELDTKELSKLIHKVGGNGSFLILAVDLMKFGGCLPKSAWSWIKKREDETVGLVSEPQGD